MWPLAPQLLDERAREWQRILRALPAHTITPES